MTRSPTSPPTVANTPEPTSLATPAPTFSTAPSVSVYPSSVPSQSTEPSVVVTSNPTITPVFHSSISGAVAENDEDDNFVDTMQQQQQNLGGGGGGWPTWVPTTFIPTATYPPTIYIDWSFGGNNKKNNFQTGFGGLHGGGYGGDGSAAGRIEELESTSP